MPSRIRDRELSTDANLNPGAASKTDPSARAGIKRKPVAAPSAARVPAPQTDILEAQTTHTKQAPQRRVLKKKPPATGYPYESGKVKGPSISSRYIQKDEPYALRPSWQNGKGPIASKRDINKFLNEAVELAPYAKKATTRARINLWASAAAGVAAGVGVGVGLSMVAGPAVGVFMGAIMATMTFGLFKKLLLTNSKDKLLKQSQAAFHANLGATMRAAHADPRIARLLDGDKRWKEAVVLLNDYYPGRPIHQSLARAFDPALKLPGEGNTMWGKSKREREREDE